MPDSQQRPTTGVGAALRAFLGATRLRKVLFTIGVLLALLGGSAAVLPPLLWGDHADYSQVASIEATREYQDPALLAKAWALPVASLYRKQIEYQGNPSFCGPTSLVNVMHSLQLGADQRTVLEGSGRSTVFGLLLGGIRLDDLAVLTRQRLGKRVTLLRDLDLPGFREQLQHVNDPSRRYIVNFSRGPLFGRGGGHHSPIAGYLADEDLVLVLDVNRKYGPWLVKPERLYQAMNTFDRGAEKKRGLLLIE
jgi:Phytochelatin synthase